MEVFDEFKELVKKLGREESLDRIQSHLKSVSSITQQSIAEILECCDFKKGGKLSIEKLEAILAETRSVIFLHDNYFIDIKLLKAYKTKKRPDLYAKITTKKFDIEVTCLTEAHSRQKQGIAYRLIDGKFLREFTGRITDKLKQLENGGNNFKMIIFVLNRYPEKALYKRQEYEKLIKQAYKKSRLCNNWYLGLVTGYDNEDFTYPSLTYDSGRQRKT